MRVRLFQPGRSDAHEPPDCLQLRDSSGADVAHAHDRPDRAGHREVPLTIPCEIPRVSRKGVVGIELIALAAKSANRLQPVNELGFRFCPLRKQNSKRPLPPWVTYLISSYRKIVETTGSMIERILPKHIHAVTAAGFELKVALFLLACSVSYLG